MVSSDFPGGVLMNIVEIANDDHSVKVR